MTAATSRVFQKDHLTAVEAAYMAAQVPGAFKVTMMSVAMGAMTWRAEVAAAAYPDPANWSMTWWRCRSRRSAS